MRMLPTPSQALTRMHQHTHAHIHPAQGTSEKFRCWLGGALKSIAPVSTTLLGPQKSKNQDSLRKHDQSTWRPQTYVDITSSTGFAFRGVGSSMDQKGLNFSTSSKKITSSSCSRHNDKTHASRPQGEKSKGRIATWTMRVSCNTLTPRHSLMMEFSLPLSSRAVPGTLPSWTRTTMPTDRV